MFGASIGSIVPWQSFITSREFNLNFSWKEGKAVKAKGIHTCLKEGTKLEEEKDGTTA